MAICIYPQDCTDFASNGLGLLTPVSCVITEEERGMFELEVIQPIDDTLRWAQLEPGCIIKAPVPTRESPLYAVEDPETPAPLPEPKTVTRNVWTVTGTSTGAYMRAGPGVSYKHYGYLKNGAKVTEIGRKTVSGRVWINCIVQKGGRKCWMSTRWLRVTGTVDETIDGTKVAAPTPTTQRSVTPLQAQEQLFRIYKVERDARERTVTAYAMHIFYDLRANIVNDDYELEPTQRKSANTVLTELWGKLATPETDFQLHIDATVNKKIDGNYGWKNPVECMLDPEDGVLSKAKALLVRDNYDIYVIPDTPHETGVTIRRGKNLKGVTVTQDNSGIVTRIIPTGKGKSDGKDDKDTTLYLDGTKWVDSPHLSEYPFPYVQKIQYDVSIVDKDSDNETSFTDAAKAREKLRELAQKEFDENGIDLPSYNLEVDFVLLQNAPDISEGYADLQAVFLGDTVTVIDSLIDLTARLRVTSYEWNALTQQYTKVRLGEVETLQQTVYSYNLPTGSISGTKLAEGSTPGTVLRDATIEYAKMSVAAIEQLTADTIVALSAHIQEIIASQITTDELYASFAELSQTVIEKAEIDWASIESLKASVAELTKAAIGVADIGWGQIKDLITKEAIITEGEAGRLYIDRLMVSFAQMAAATIGDLVIQASDGNYYQLDVSSDGTVTSKPVEVSEGEIESGHTDSGGILLDTSISADSLSTSDLFATFALINKIDAARIDVDQLFAREAFITLLRTSEIFGGESLDFWVGDSIRSVVTEYYLSDSPSVLTGGGWSAEYPADVPEGKYLWRHIKTTKRMSGDEITGEECITGQTGEQGPAGVGIESIEEYYALSGDTTPPAQWEAEPQTPTPDLRYHWNKEKFTYTDTSTQETDPHIIGVFGDEGKMGRGVKEVINRYLASDKAEGVTRGSTGWTTTMQTTSEAKRYLWTYEETVWNDGSANTYTSPIIIGIHGEQGETGAPGSDGKGIKSIDEYYALSTTTTSPADASFKTTIPVMTATYRYLWNYELISYTDGSSGQTGKHIIGTYGQSGKNGAYCTPHEQYYLSTSATAQSGGAWAEGQPEWEEGRYLWERLRLVWSDGSADTFTTPSRATALERAIQDASDAAGLAGDALSAANDASESAARAADSANSAAKNASDALSKAQQMEAAVNDMNITLRHMKFDPEEGLIVTAKDINDNDSIWYSVVRETGFAVCNSTLVNQEVFYAYRDRCRILNLEIGMDSEVVAKATTTGGTVWGPAD